MAQKKGMVTTCDRCGASVFSKLTGKEAFDGGYSSRDTFEPLPDGWEYERVQGKYTYLCPECAQLWRDIGNKFMDREVQA